MTRPIDYEHVAAILARRLVRRCADALVEAQYLDGIGDTCDSLEHRVAAAEIVRQQAALSERRAAPAITDFDAAIAAGEPPTLTELIDGLRRTAESHRRSGDYGIATGISYAVQLLESWVRASVRWYEARSADSPAEKAEEGAVAA